MRPAGSAALLVLAIWMAVSPAPGFASEMGAGELNSLIEKHLPFPDPGEAGITLDPYEQAVSLADGAGATVFRIPGFNRYGCGACHTPEALVDRAAERLGRVLARLAEEVPGLPTHPVRQYIIQPYEDALLGGRQLAHATFDTIRISPASILIDTRVYGEATHRHEILHLAQPFLGHVNELEAYGLNLSDDPQFLILNFPYFEDVTRLFFVPGLPEMLNDYFARGVNEGLRVPREVQWFLMGIDEATREALTRAVAGLKPLLSEVGRLYRAQPLAAAYWSARTGICSFLLDLAAARLLPLPDLSLPEERVAEALAMIDQQMRKDDNTRLGYVIDRKKEALLNLRYALKIDDPRERLVLYFHYLKRRFVAADGAPDLAPVESDREDFLNFISGQLAQVRKMADYPGLTEIERQAAAAWLAGIQKKIPDSPKGKPGD